MIRLKASVISNKDLIGRSGWLGMRTRDILQRGRLRLSDKLPLDNSIPLDKVISLNLRATYAPKCTEKTYQKRLLPSYSCGNTFFKQRSKIKRDFFIYLSAK
jgi:hypothetical protein